MCVSIGVRVATITTRSFAPYIGALLTSVPASVFSPFFMHETLPVFAFAPLRLCTSAPLRLCSSLVSLRCSSVLLCLSSLLLLCLSSRHRLFCLRLCFCIRLCSAFARRSTLQHLAQTQLNLRLHHRLDSTRLAGARHYSRAGTSVYAPVRTCCNRPWFPRRRPPLIRVPPPPSNQPNLNLCVCWLYYSTFERSSPPSEGEDFVSLVHPQRCREALRSVRQWPSWKLKFGQPLVCKSAPNQSGSLREARAPDE